MKSSPDLSSYRYAFKKGDNKSLTTQDTKAPHIYMTRHELIAWGDPYNRPVTAMLIRSQHRRRCRLPMPLRLVYAGLRVL